MNALTNDNIVVFNVTRLGASHIKHNKPCQDASYSWHNDDNTVQIAIVCDGHGGDTYVRSDRGAKIAAEIAAKYLRQMNDNSEVFGKLFFGKSGSVTARPINKRKVFDPKNLSETELIYQRQDELFRRQYLQNQEQDKVLQGFFEALWKEWLDTIHKDSENDPFTEYEKALLGENRIAKAYGCTLLAFLRTPYYWFAFQIGDGKMLSCDNTLTWKEPVPWDHNCFLNRTTSLCYSNPLPYFRYAYDGEGKFPMAVIMGSDGLDDSWVSMANLQDFYTQTLRIFSEHGYENTLTELADYLSELSKKGSHDDMSMSGIIDLSSVPMALKMYNLRKEGLKLQSEFQTRQKELEKNKADVKEAEKRIDEADKQIGTCKKLLKDTHEQIKDLEQLKAQTEIEKKELLKKSEEFSSLDDIARKENNRLKKEWNALKEEVEKSDEKRRELWRSSLGILPWENINNKEEEPQVITIPNSEDVAEIPPVDPTDETVF